jgi:hypothetical protein
MQASPRLRFNKEGSLLAVTASDNGIKILANRDGIQMLRALEARVYDTNNRAPQEPAVSKVSLNFIYTRHFLEFETTRAFTFMVQWK